jgi:drug/metabolite transporter (DMT)-like permease
MDPRVIGIGLVITSVLVLSAAQFIIKSRLSVHGEIPFSPREFVDYLLSAAGDWRLWLGFILLVLAALCWYTAVSRIPLSIAYPVGALAYPVIFLGAVVLLREPFSWTVLVGNLLVVAGVVVAAGLKGA